ncbi:MAG: hypothetical protein DRN20_01555, partial [Thermoplasmata archaeon]
VIAVRPMELVYVPAIAMASLFLFLSIIKIADLTMKNLFNVFLMPCNLLLAYAHMLDATATYRAITVYAYSEKHVLPSAIIAHLGPWALYLAKFAVVFMLIYVLDVMYKEANTELRGTIKLVAYILGMAPGLRDMLRIAFGV